DPATSCEGMDPRAEARGILMRPAGMAATIAPQIGAGDLVIGLEPLEAGSVGAAAEIFRMVDRIDSIRGAGNHIAAVAIAAVLMVGCIRRARAKAAEGDDDGNDQDSVTSAHGGPPVLWRQLVAV